VLNAPKEELYKAIVINEKLGGNSWLVDPVQAKYPNSFKKIQRTGGVPRVWKGFKGSEHVKDRSK